MLTELQVKAAKPKEKRYMLRDDRGLYLEIMPGGNRYWRMRYWADGKERKLTLGEYPEVSLRVAREKRDAIRLDRSRGIEPGVKKSNGPTFEEIAREWHTRMIVPDKTPKYIYKTLSRLEKFAFPFIGSHLIGEVSTADLLSMIRAIEARGLNETAHTVHQICGQVFRYAVASGRADRNPAADLKGALTPIVVRHRASLTDPKDIAGLMRAIDSLRDSVIVRCALLFSAYTFQRPGEVRQAEWSEFDFDEKLWRIAAEKMKMRRPHLVPMATQVLKVLEEIRPLTGHGRYVFPSIRTPDGSRAMSEATITAALRRLGYTGEEMTAHGFRSMASTNLNEQGWSSDAIERQLAHVEGGVRSVYNYAEYLPERRRMMQHWADWLDGLGQM